jgi:3-mercaptopyruvate sulfurtransferase SseA
MYGGFVMMHNCGRKRAWLALGLLMSLLPATAAFSQQKKGAFIDGEFVEDYVYVPEFMTPEELKKHIDERSAGIVIVDTAATLIFDEEHIPGAVNFPWVKSITPPVPLPRDKTLVIYYACKDHEDSVDMAKKLSLLGYLNVKVLKGGWFKWLDLGYKTVSKEEEKAAK